MNKENNILAELPNLSPASQRTSLLKNNTSRSNRVLKRKPLSVKKVLIDKSLIDMQTFKNKSVISSELFQSRGSDAKLETNMLSGTKRRGNSLKSINFLADPDTNNKHKYSIFEKMPNEITLDTTEKTLANFNAEKSSSAPLRFNTKEQKKYEENFSAPTEAKEDLKNEFWMGESVKEKTGSEYRPLLNWKKQQHIKTETGLDYKPLWQHKSKNMKNNMLQHLGSNNQLTPKTKNASVYTGETYNEPNILFETTEKNRKLYDKIGGYKASILEIRQEHNRLEMVKIPMITYEISKKEIVLNKLKDDMRFFNKDIERINQNHELTEEENELRLKNHKIKLDVGMNGFLSEQDQILNKNIKEQETKYSEWKHECEKNYKDLEDLKKVKLQLLEDNKNLSSEIEQKKIKEKLELEMLRQDRKEEIENEKSNFVHVNINFVANSKLEKKRTELLSLSDEKQQENETLTETLQAIVQKIKDERFLLTTVTDDEQMKSSELMKYGLEKMHPLEAQLKELKMTLQNALTEEEKIKKEHIKLSKFITTIQKKIDTLK